MIRPKSRRKYPLERQFPELTEGSAQEDDFLFFGFVVGLESEFGYFLLSELETVRTPLGLSVERDLFFREGKLTDIVPAPEL